MIVYAPAKINIGLKVLNKRKDNYHNLDSLFYPIPLNDILEFNTSQDFSFTSSGLPIDGPIHDNLIYKAYRLMNEEYGVKGLKAHLHKIIPMGAGLGGGSSDAAATLVAINELYSLELTKKQLAKLALKLGADCPFFIYNRPMRARGIGEIFEEVQLSLKSYYLQLINPKVHISTAEAYSGVYLEGERASLNMEVIKDIYQWRNYFNNSFEIHLFKQHPLLADLKETLYKNGAIYASMSGSGSTVFGLFENQPAKILEWNDYDVWTIKL